MFNRQVVERHLASQPTLSLSFVVPDHPWVDSANGADVRIAMSVGGAAADSGTLLNVLEERVQEDGEALVTFDIRKGLIHADLSIGAKVGSAQRLVANAGIWSHTDSYLQPSKVHAARDVLRRHLEDGERSVGSKTMFDFALESC